MTRHSEARGWLRKVSLHVIEILSTKHRKIARKIGNKFISSPMIARQVHLRWPPFRPLAGVGSRKNRNHLALIMKYLRGLCSLPRRNHRNVDHLSIDLTTPERLRMMTIGRKRHTTASLSWSQLPTFYGSNSFARPGSLSRLAESTSAIVVL